MRLVSPLILGFILVVTACGRNDEDQPAAAAPVAETVAEPAPTPASTGIVSGKYFMTAGTVEAFDDAGNKLDPQQLQITGDYFWIVEDLGEKKLEVTASGSAKISNSNAVLTEINCRGAQDVYVFDVTASGALRNFQITESGCPQSLQGSAAQQRSLAKLGNDAFGYTIVNQAEGVRMIETYTFKKQ